MYIAINIKDGANLGFLSDNWQILLFFAVLIGAFLHQRLIRKRPIDSDEMLALIWISVATSLTLVYAAGAFDFFFNRGAALGFTLSDVNMIAVPGAITIVYLAIDRFIKYLNRRRRKS